MRALLAIVSMVAVWAAAEQVRRPGATVTARAPTAATSPSPVVENPTADVPGFGDLTVITSDRLIYDGRRQYIELEGSVIISDPQVKMKADRVIVTLAGTNEVREVVATGRVVISQADKHAWAGKATYHVAEGKFVLEESPRILRGRELLTADRIVFWRDQDRLECWPNARLIIQPEPGQKSDFLKGLR